MTKILWKGLIDVIYSGVQRSRAEEQNDTATSHTSLDIMSSLDEKLQVRMVLGVEKLTVRIIICYCSINIM